MFMAMLAILALTLYVFRPMGRRRQLANSDKPSSSHEVNVGEFNKKNIEIFI